MMETACLDSGPADICPGVQIASAMGDAELCAYIAGALSQVKKILRDILPYLAEARRRFAQPGRRVPVPGRPTWGEWVQGEPWDQRPACPAAVGGGSRAAGGRR